MKLLSILIINFAYFMTISNDFSDFSIAVFSIPILMLGLLLISDIENEEVMEQVEYFWIRIFASWGCIFVLVHTFGRTDGLGMALIFSLVISSYNLFHEFMYEESMV